MMKRFYSAMEEEVPDFTNLHGELRDYFDSGVTRSAQWRKNQLEGLIKMMEENEDRFCEALKADLGKSKMEAVVSEILTLKVEARDSISQLEEWMKPEQVGTPGLLLPASSGLLPSSLTSHLILLL